MHVQRYCIFTIAIALSTMGTEKMANNNAAVNVNISVQPINSPQHVGTVPEIGVGVTRGLLQESSQSLGQLANSLKSKIKSSIVPLSIIMTTGAFALLWIDLYTTRRLLNNPESWCSWKQHCTLDYLAQQPRNELCDPLLLAIQERYMSLDDPTNNTAPLSSFLPALNQELKQLERYCYWAKRLIAWHCAWAFPVDKKTYEKAQEAIARLRFVKKIFIQWWATHNMQLHTQTEPVPTRYRKGIISGKLWSFRY